MDKDYSMDAEAARIWNASKSENIPDSVIEDFSFFFNYADYKAGSPLTLTTQGRNRLLEKGLLPKENI